VSTGTVIAGWFGTERTRSYTVMGDAVNVASRLESASERGEFLINESTYNLVSHLFEWEECEPIQVKGKPDPLKIYRLLGVSSGERPKPPEVPIIGRDYDLNLLVEQYQKLLAGQGGVVTIIGEAGMGKSRLISEFEKQVNREPGEQTPRWLFGRGVSYRQAFKNRLFVDILHDYLGLPENPDDTLVKMRLEAMGEKLFGNKNNEVVPYLAALLGLSLDDDLKAELPIDDPQILEQRILLAVGQWIEALVLDQPVVMVFEDLHWADPSSVDLIEYLFHLTIHYPILLVCASRPEREAHFWNIKANGSKHYDNNFTELALWPLTDEESRQLIKHQLKIDQMPEAIEHLILSRAEGNPLFLEEVVRSLIEEGSIVHTEDGHWEITRSATEINIPDTLQGVLNARIDRLKPEVKEIIQIAAVIGRVFPRFILAPIVNKSDEVLADALKQLQAADLIQQKPAQDADQVAYIFKHLLTHEIVYSSLLHEQRKAIHKRIADHMAFKVFWMLGEEYAPIVAEHYDKSETWPRAMRYLQRAAEAAIQSFAHHEALNFYTRALEVADRIGPDVDQNAVMTIYEGRAKMLARLGKPQDAIADYEAMLDIAKEANDDSAQMRALNGLGALQADHYSFSKASSFFHEALAVVRRIGDAAGTADTLNKLGSFYSNIGELNKGLESYQEARQISINLQDEFRRIEAEDGLAKIMLEQGEVEASLSRYQGEIINVRQRLGFRNGLMSSLSSMLIAQVYVADYMGANETAEQALELQRGWGDLYHTPFIKYYQAFGQIHQGELGAAGSNLIEGVRLAEEHGQRASQTLGLTWLSYFYLNVGSNEEGLGQAQEAAAIARELGSPLYELRAKFMIGSANRHLGQTEQAITVLDRVLNEAKTMGLALDEAMILYQLSRALIDANRWDKAAAATAQLLDLSSKSGLKEFVVRGQWVQSLIDTHHKQFEDGLETLIAASELAETLDSRLSQYLIQIQKAQIYHMAGNDAASRDSAAYAQKIQKRLADSLSDDKQRHVFLNNLHAQHLAKILKANIGTQVKVEAVAGDSS
ncbi:MAG: AAA family ATPase, partial [Anaerolineae bacterium]|nr:AAA family ATPase [Anaerolineae bacterium]